jgi:hypothetical protein
VGSRGYYAATQGGRVLSGSTALSLDDSIKFMHVSAPIRVMEQAEWAPSGLREFGLDPPGYTAILYRGNAPVLGAEFGAQNPQKVLRPIMRLPSTRRTSRPLPPAGEASASS